MDDQYQYVTLRPPIGQPTWVELITVGDGTRTPLHRDLFDPAAYGTIRDLVLALGMVPDLYDAYLRLPGNELEPAGWGTPLSTNMSVVLVRVGGPPDRIARVRWELGARPEILPSRTSWPV